MKLNAVAAMQLSLTDLQLYASTSAIEYLSMLDLAAADDILKKFKDPVKAYMKQLMTSRKYFLLQEADNFLGACAASGKQGQVVLMASGASPLSIHLSASFPGAHIWDVGNNFIKEKSLLMTDQREHLHFIDAEITDVEDWYDQLHFTGFDPTAPSLFIVENMYFYMKPEEMKSIVCKAKELNAIICGDYMIQQANITATAKTSLQNSFEAMHGFTDLGKMRFYTRLEFASLLDTCGYRDLRFFPISDIQRERTGSFEPFLTENGSPVEMWTVR